MKFAIFDVAKCRMSATSLTFLFHFDLDSDSEIVTRDSGPSHARVQAVAAVPCCAVYSDIWYILLCVFMFWKINKVLNMWTTRFVTRTRKKNLTRSRGLGLWGDDSDSDFEVMTRTRTWTQRWWLGLGLGFDNLDSDTALMFRSNLFILPEEKAMYS